MEKQKKKWENKYMKEADDAVEINARYKYTTGGPFGAVIVKNGEIIAKACNSVISSNDPTAHAEINAIRKACQILKTSDLSECEVYTTCYPCPMCLSAIIWANIKKIYYGNTKEDAKDIGFRDDYIYEILKNPEDNTSLNLVQLDRENTIDRFTEFKVSEEKIVY